MKKISSTCRISFNNIPILNLRSEFKTYLKLFRDDEFRDQFDHLNGNIKTPYFQWCGTSDEVLSLLLQRAILGVEAYISVATYFKLHEDGRLTSPLAETIKKPFKIKGKGQGTAETYFNKLPKIISNSFQIKKSNPNLWNKVKDFYREVRNPIFHGYQIDDGDPQEISKCYELIAEIYTWIDSWYPNKWVSGEGTLGDFN